MYYLNKLQFKSQFCGQTFTDWNRRTNNGWEIQNNRFIWENAVIETLKNNDYNHEVPARQSVITCTYLEVHKDVKEGTIYCIEQKKKAIMSTYCIAGVCPVLEIR